VMVAVFVAGIIVGIGVSALALAVINVLQD
jgi:hypothetical protein